jgi:hypothetical protein
VKTFTTGEMAAGLVRQWRTEPALSNQDDADALAYFERLVSEECEKRGITEAELLAIVDEKRAFNRDSDVP